MHIERYIQSFLWSYKSQPAQFLCAALITDAFFSYPNQTLKIPLAVSLCLTAKRLPRLSSPTSHGESPYPLLTREVTTIFCIIQYIRLFRIRLTFFLASLVDTNFMSCSYRRTLLNLVKSLKRSH